jgi:hypothetical protein
MLRFHWMSWFTDTKDIPQGGFPAAAPSISGSKHNILGRAVAGVAVHVGIVWQEILRVSFGAQLYGIKI